jgi:hypothetical protein
VAMNKKQILETMKKTGGSVLIQQRGKPTAHFAHPSAVPEDDVLARGDPEAERLTAEQLEAHAQQLLARAQALRPLARSRPWRSPRETGPGRPRRRPRLTRRTRMTLRTPRAGPPGPERGGE